MNDRRKARILAMQALCQFEVLGGEWLAQLNEFIADEGDPAAVQSYARKIVIAAVNNVTDLDRHIAGVSEHWDVKRMSAVDRNIIRVAAQEFLTDDPDVPPAVVINEAIEISKLFSAADSPAFINGLLDALTKALKNPPVPIPEPVPAPDLAAALPAETTITETQNP